MRSGLALPPSDQLYHLIEGLMNIQLATEIHHIRAETFVFIPAGLAHRNWNEGPGDETHLEMMIPAPAPMAPLTIMVDSPDDVPAANRTDRDGYTRRVDRAQLSEPLRGLRVQPLSAPAPARCMPSSTTQESTSAARAPTPTFTNSTSTS